MPRKNVKWALVPVLSACILGPASCNEGVKGFDAESGSTVSMGESSGSYKIGAGGLVDQFSSVTVLGADGQPKNGVSVQFICFQCELIHTVSGNCDDITVSTPLEAKPSPYWAKTNGRGFCEVVVRLRSPADVGVEQYTAHFGASIGVASKVQELEVQLPDAE